MSVYRLNSNKPVTFVDHTGVSFYKNLIKVYNLTGGDLFLINYVPDATLNEKISFTQQLR